MRGAVAHVTEMIETGKIPLIFDLDETLVLAHTIFSLRNRAIQISVELAALKDASSALDPSERLSFCSFQKSLQMQDERAAERERDLGHRYCSTPSVYGSRSYRS